MRPALAIALLVLTGAAVQGQQLNYDIPPESVTNAAPSTVDPPLSLEREQELNISAAQPEAFVLKDKARITGPLVHPAKAKSLLDFSWRLLDLVNPFAKSAAPDQRLRVQRDSRAWSTVVGWSPGRSAFPDDEHQQGGLRLLSVSTGTGE